MERVSAVERGAMKLARTCVDGDLTTVRLDSQTKSDASHGAGPRLQRPTCNVPPALCKLQSFAAWQQRQEMVTALAMAFDFRGFAVGEAVIGGDDADRQPTLLIEKRRAESAAELQLELRAVACGDGLEDMDGPLEGVDKRENLGPASPYARLAHRAAIFRRRHTILLSSRIYQLRGDYGLLSLEMERPIGIISERLHGKVA